MPAPEGSRERAAARRRLIMNAQSHRFVGVTPEDWKEIVRDYYSELVETVGEKDLDAIALYEWSVPVRSLSK